MIRLFYAVPDFFPPWRLDVDELFSRQLPLHGVDVTWSMQRKNAGSCSQETHAGQTVYLPLRLNHGEQIGKVANKFLQYACELGLFFKLLTTPHWDVIQVRDRRYFFAFLGWLASRLRGSKFVYWSSYPFPEHVIEMAAGKKKLARLMYLLRGYLSWFYVYRFIMRLADHVFVQSEQMFRDMVGYGVPHEKMTPVPMGVPPRLLDWAKADEQQKIVPGKVVYVGTLARVRRLGVLIEAFALVHKRNSDAHLFMVGEGDIPAERAELEALVRQHGLESVVTFTGFIPMEHAWAQAADAEVCLSPIFPTPVLNAGSPTKLVEYMALGRPVVANDQPDQAAILRDSGAGLCVSWGAESFAEAITELLADPERAHAMGARGPAWVATNRAYDKLATLVYERYQVLLGDKS